MTAEMLAWGLSVTTGDSSMSLKKENWDYVFRGVRGMETLGSPRNKRILQHHIGYRNEVRDPNKFKFPIIAHRNILLSNETCWSASVIGVTLPK
jgi:hypothetical protein